MVLLEQDRSKRSSISAKDTPGKNYFLKNLENFAGPEVEL